MVDQGKPYIDKNYIRGGNRTGYPLGDAWAIVAKGLPPTTSIPCGEKLLEIVDAGTNPKKLEWRMKAHARAMKLDCAA